jgi:hypothetical protein
MILQVLVLTVFIILYGVYGYTGGGLGSDPTASAGVYGYSVYGYGTADIVIVVQGYGNSVNYIGVFGVGLLFMPAILWRCLHYRQLSSSSAKLKQNVKDVTSAME